jgi:DNA (cytosine-5)-methyltransferase 1
MSKKYTAISLFSGLGGDSLGLKLANCDVIAYNELNKTFCKSHDSNFPNSKLICDNNITDISKLKDDCFKPYKNKTDILFAGFPCQGFSNAGKKKVNDPRNTMFLEFLRVTKLTNPEMIIGENVKGLLSRKTDKNELYIDVISSEFNKLGYDIIYKVFKCHEYNTPQKRERLIILGIKNNNKYNWELKFPEPISKDLNLKSIINYDMTGAHKVSDDLFKDIPSECILTDNNDNNEYDINNKSHPYLISKINASDEQKCYKDKTHDNLFSFQKRISPIHCEIIDIRKPSKTIICSYNHQPRLFVPLKNKSGCFLRMLLPDELKQIQGFPKDYIVCGNIKEKITQIGNAVPPNLVCSIVKNII